MYILLYISYTWTHIWRYLKRVMVLKFLVYSVNNTRRPLLYVISLCVWPISFSPPLPKSKPRDNIDGPDVTCIECIWCMAAQMACIFPSGYGERMSVWYHLWCLKLLLYVNQSFDDHSFESNLGSPVPNSLWMIEISRVKTFLSPVSYAGYFLENKLWAPQV